MRNLLILFFLSLIAQPSLVFGENRTFMPPISSDNGPAEVGTIAEKINHLLLAYQLESAGQLEAAKQQWRSLPKSKSKSNHLFFIQFFLNQPVKPATKLQVLFQANYYIWKHRYKKAKNLLKKQKSLGSAEKLVLIHLNLALGDYQKAYAALGKFQPKNLEEKEKQLLLRLWYFQLTHQNAKAKQAWANLQKEFLYQDWGNIALSQSTPNKAQLETALLLQLGSEQLLEKLFFAYKDKKEKIALIEKFEGNMSGWVVHSPLMPEELRPHLKQIFSYLNSSDSTPNDFELWASYWVKNREAEKLKKLSELYLKRFPELEDGKVYLLKSKKLMVSKATKR